MSPLSPRLAKAMQVSTLLLTYAIKLVGLGSAFNQLLLAHKDPRPFPLAVAAFMMAGAHFSEGQLLAMFGRLMAVEPAAKDAKDEKVK